MKPSLDPTDTRVILQRVCIVVLHIRSTLSRPTWQAFQFESQEAETIVLLPGERLRWECSSIAVGNWPRPVQGVCESSKECLVRRCAFDGRGSDCYEQLEVLYLEEGKSGTHLNLVRRFQFRGSS